MRISNIDAIALIDANNFYASCEQNINPHLRNKPVVILSNNDGCIIARSPEARALKIKMGTPYFKLKLLALRRYEQKTNEFTKKPL